MQTNTNNVNKTWSLLQTTVGIDEPNTEDADLSQGFPNMIIQFQYNLIRRWFIPSSFCINGRNIMKCRGCINEDYILCLRLRGTQLNLFMIHILDWKETHNSPGREANNSLGCLLNGLCDLCTPGYFALTNCLTRMCMVIVTWMGWSMIVAFLDVLSATK